MIVQTVTHSTCFFLISAFLFSACPTVMAVELEADGAIIEQSDGKKAITNDFQVYVKDCQWALFRTSTIFFPTSSIPNLRLVVEISNDGTNCYKFSYLETNATSIFHPLDFSSLITNSLSGNIYSSNFPCKILEPGLIALFYSFASSCYFNTATSNLIPAIIFQPNDLLRGDRMSQAIISRDLLSPNLPNSIRFYDVSGRWLMAALEGHYFTIVGGLHLPNEIVLSRYYEEETNVLTTYHFYIQRLEQTCPLTSFVPALPGRAIITDYRFSPKDSHPLGVTQLTTNKWPSLEDSKSQKGYAVTQVHKQTTNSSGGSIHTRRLMVRLALSAVLFVGGVLIVRLFSRKNKWNETL